jgi:IS1 family transposase
MGSDLLVDALVLFVLLWLCVILPSYLWRDDWPAGCVTTATPAHKGSSKPKPFPGLIHKPHCDACEQAAQAPAVPRPPAVPPPIISTRGRRRVVDTSSHFCPPPRCAYWGRMGLGNLSANGHPSGRTWRQLHCTVCGGYFLETYGTLFHGKHVCPQMLLWAVGALAEGLGIRAVARVFAVEPDTVLAWLVEAADQLQRFSQYVLRDVQVTQVQLDELYALLREVKAGEVGHTDAIKRLQRSPHWVWTAIDPVSRLLLVIDAGERTLAMAQRLVHQVADVLVPNSLPLFLTDGHKDYLPAILSHFGHWVQPERRQRKGPVPKPRWMPRPGLLYAQVIKTVRRRRLVRVTHRVVFGTLEAVTQVLAPYGWQINTALVERLSLDLRHHIAAIGRRVTTLCTHEAGLRQQLVLYQVYHNFVVPHASLRQALAEPEPTNGTGSARQWRPCTPAMAAGLTDHVWSLQEGLLFRVPPWPQPHAV